MKSAPPITIMIFVIMKLACTLGSESVVLPPHQKVFSFQHRLPNGQRGVRAWVGESFHGKKTTERERETEIEIETETERQRDRDRDRETETETERGGEKGKREESS